MSDVFEYDFLRFRPGSDPTYLYTEESVAPAIRDALREDRLHSAVELPPYHGGGTRPHHVRIELDYCAYPDGTPVFDVPEKINQGRVKFVRADSEELTFSADHMSWEQLCERLHNFMLDWGMSLRERLQAAHQARLQMEEAQKQLDRAKGQLRRELKAVRTLGGLSAGDIARLTAVPPRTVQAYIDRK